MAGVGVGGALTPTDASCPFPPRARTRTRTRSRLAVIQDSDVGYTAASGAKVVLSGGAHLGGLDWKPSADNPILKALWGRRVVSSFGTWAVRLCAR